MEVNNKKNKSTLDIKKELIANDLNELLKSLIIFFIVAILCGYVGYIYSKDNNLSIARGIIFGILFPLGTGLLELIDCNNLFSFIVYTFLYLLIVSNIPTFVGGIILFIVIGIFIIDFIYIEKRDRTTEIEEYIKNRTTNSTKPSSYNINEYTHDNYDFKEDKEEFECEMCFKKISEEEYELYDCMCEECFIDMHTDKDGNFHDEIDSY